MKSTTLFLPEEHIVLSDWLGVEPIEKPENSLTVREALEKLNLARNLYSYSDSAAAVADFILERIQDELPQWAGTSHKDGSLVLAREIKKRLANRTIELLPKELFTINWAGTGPGFDWPVVYFSTFVPLYNVYIVTSSADADDMFGACDFALGHFSGEDDVVGASLKIIKADWVFQRDECEQSRWEELLDNKLISEEKSRALADQVW